MNAIQKTPQSVSVYTKSSTELWEQSVSDSGIRYQVNGA